MNETNRVCQTCEADISGYATGYVFCNLCRKVLDREAVDNGWRFNRNYKDLDQVAQFVDDYFAIFSELEAIPVYPYNDLFKYRIPGIKGPNEDPAIYLLQKIRSKLEDWVKVKAALDAGCQPVTSVTESTKYHRVVHYGWRNGEDGYQEWADARIIPYCNGMAVLPKGKRTQGFILSGKVLVA